MENVWKLCTTNECSVPLIQPEKVMKIDITLMKELMEYSKTLKNALVTMQKIFDSHIGEAEKYQEMGDFERSKEFIAKAENILCSIKKLEKSLDKNIIPM